MNNETSAPLRLAMLESDRMVRECLAAALEHRGFAVIGRYADPAHLLEQLESDRPQVALIDVGDADATGLVEHVTRTHPSVRVLVLSSSAESAQDYFRAGATGCLERPSTSCDSLFEALVAVAGGTSVYPPRFLDSILRVPEHRTAASDLLGTLSHRERQVLAYVAAGADNLKIASHLGISERTVKAHVSSLYRKLTQENRTQLALLAQRLGVRPPADL